MINLQAHPVGEWVTEDGYSMLCVEVDSINKFEAIRLLEHAQVHLIFHTQDPATRNDWPVVWSACCEFRAGLYCLLREIEHAAD